MGLFGRRREGAGPAAAEPDGSWPSFYALVIRELAGRGLLFEPEDDCIRITSPRTMTVGLTNLWQQCRSSPVGEWEATVRRFLDRLLDSDDDPDDERFDDVRDHIKVRLYPSDYAAGLEVAVLARPFAEGVQAVLTIDRPTVVATFPPENLERWGVGEEELFRLGYHNVRVEPRPEMERLSLEDGVDVTVLEGASFFTTTKVLWLEELLGPLPEHGVLVAMPVRNVLLVHSIEGFGAVLAVRHLLELSRRIHDEGPGSLSPH
ncbi:MAG: hypothetical protein LC733_09420, partial [Actinobacteria bacterium]|nr:hypothetical protein [Actinomycetota bacterium]